MLGIWIVNNWWRKLGLVAISDVLMEGVSHLRHIPTRGEGDLKSEDFRGDIIYEWPLGDFGVKL